MSDDVRHYIQRGAQLRSKRGNWETQWEESARRVIPEHSGSFFSRQTHNLNGSEGQKKTQDAYDSTAIIANQRFSAVIESLITPQNSFWAHLRPADKMLKNNRQARKFYEEFNEALFRYRYRPVANFVGNSQQSYASIGAYGNGILFVDQPDDSPGLRYKNIHLGEIYFVPNHAGVIDTAYRFFRMSVNQMVEKFANVPESVRSKNANPSQMEEELEIMHIVEPRRDYDPNRMDHVGMRFKSCYVFVPEQVKLQEGGFRTFPYPIARYTQAPNEIYGRGPTQMVLPSIKVINQEKKDTLIQGQRTLSPVLLSHDDGNLGGFSMKSGALNAGGLNKDGKRMVDTLPTGNLAAGFELMEMEAKTINDAFLITLFQILLDSPQMTATEVLERAREKGMLVAPTAGRLQAEFLGRLIEREVDLLAQQGLVPELPPILQDPEAMLYTIEYNSPMSRMREAEKASGFMRSLSMTLEHVQATGDASPLDWFDFDVAVPAIQQINGAPVEWTRAEEAVEEIRAGRAEKEAQQQAIDALPAVAGMAKSGAAPGQESPE